MSAAPALASVSTRARAAQDAPALAPVVMTRAQRRARPRAIYAGIAVIGVFGILVTQLLLSIALSDGAYRISALQSQAVELERDAQVLVESLDTLRSPQYLAANAESLGMIANENPAYLRLADAAVLGAPVAAGQGVGLLEGRETAIGNVLLADVPLVVPLAGGETPGVAPASIAPASVASSPAAPAPPGALPSPVTR